MSGPNFTYLTKRELPSQDGLDYMPIHTGLGVSIEPSIEDLLTIEELAVRLKVPKSWIYTHTRGRTKCRLPFIKLGKYLRFEEGAVRRWLESQQVGYGNSSRGSIQ
jgi:excisionase family DNA binding protein